MKIVPLMTTALTAAALAQAPDSGSPAQSSDSLERQQAMKIAVEADWASRAGPVYRTELARRLWALRQAYVASGGPLLSRDEIEQEIRRHRGESVES